MSLSTNVAVRGSYVISIQCSTSNRFARILSSPSPHPHTVSSTQISFGCEQPSSCTGQPSGYGFRVLSVALFAGEMSEAAISVLAGAAFAHAAAPASNSMLFFFDCIADLGGRSNASTVDLLEKGSILGATD